MGRMYSVSFTAVAVTAAQDLFEISPADDKPCRIAAIFLTQTTDFGDAEEEVLELLVKRGNTTSGSGGAAGTAVPLSPNTQAAGFASETNNTTRASAGTAVNLLRDGWNVRAPYALILPEDMRPEANQGNTTLIVGLEDAPADSITVNGCVLIEEL